MSSYLTEFQLRKTKCILRVGRGGTTCSLFFRLIN
jgi:hypothetical protein